MKIIKPAEISAKIMTLIDDAEKELIIVSPYNNITGWNKLLNRIKKAQHKGVHIDWYSRKNNVQSNNAEEVERNLNISPILIDDLHAKIYMNEETAIFTSMNMSRVSDEKSLDLGYLTESRNEYEEIKSFFNKHIKLPIADNKKERHLNSNGREVTQINGTEDNIITNEYHVKNINLHISKKYGKFKYNYKKEEILEYLDFIRPGFKIQFVPYSHAIRTHLYLPARISDKFIEKMIISSVELKKLHKRNELELCYDNDQRFIKYYFVDYGTKLDKWGVELISKFLKDLDIIINAFCSN